MSIEEAKTKIIEEAMSNTMRPQFTEALFVIIAELERLQKKEKKASRSLNSNSYLWVLLDEMASKLNTSKDELYLVMLDRYGVFTHTIVKPNAVDRTKQIWKLCRDLGEVVVNGSKGIQLQCFFGSSTYDQKEMNKLLNGVVSEARELGIETLEDEKINSLVKEWGK